MKIKIRMKIKNCFSIKLFEISNQGIIFRVLHKNEEW